MNLSANSRVKIGYAPELPSLFLCVVIYMAAWNAVLRPAVDLAVTPYYIFSPFFFENHILILILLSRVRHYNKL